MLKNILVINMAAEVIYFVFIGYLLMVLSALGMKILNSCKLRFNSVLQEIIISGGLGLGICIFVVLFMGLMHLLYIWLIIPLIIIINIFVLREIRAIVLKFNLAFKEVHFHWYEMLALIILGIYIILYFLVCLVPINTWDALTYYVTVPNMYVKQHAITNLLTHFNSNYPSGMEMLFTLLMVVFKGKTAGYIICQIFTVFIMVLTCFSIYSLARKFLSRVFSILSILVFISMPFVVSFDLLAKNDLGLMFYEVIAVTSLIEWIISRETKWLLMTAILSAFVFSMKYLGLYAIIAIGIIILVRSIQIERKININVLRNILLFFMVFFTFVSPWLIKSYIYTRNPIFPMFQNIFHSPLFNNWLNLHVVPRPNLANRHIVDCFTALWKIIKDFWLPLVFLFSIFLVKKNMIIRYIIIYILIHYFAWAIQFAEGGPLDYRTTFRYLDGLFPIIAILTVYSIKELSIRKYVGKFILSIFIISIVLNLPNLPKLFRKAQDNILKLSKAGIYEEFGAEYGMAPLDALMIRYINDNLPRNAKVLSCYIPFTYYLDRDVFHAMLNADTSRIFWDYDIENIFNKLKKLGIEYIIGLDNKIWPKGWAIENGGIFFKPENVNKHLNSVVTFNNEILYEIPQENYTINQSATQYINQQIPKGANIGVLSFGPIRGNPSGVNRKDLLFKPLDARTILSFSDCDYIIVNLNVKEQDKIFNQKVLERFSPIYISAGNVAIFKMTGEIKSKILNFSQHKCKDASNPQDKTG